LPSAPTTIATGTAITAITTGPAITNPTNSPKQLHRDRVLLPRCSRLYDTIWSIVLNKRLCLRLRAALLSIHQGMCYSIT
jgi:hypothetical protein